MIEIELDFQRLTGRIFVGCQLGRGTTPRARRLLQLSGGVGVVPRSKNTTFGMNSNFGIEIASPARGTLKVGMRTETVHGGEGRAIPCADQHA